MIEHVSPHPIFVAGCSNLLHVAPAHMPCGAIILRLSYASYVLGEWCGTAFNGCLVWTNQRFWSGVDRKNACSTMTLYVYLSFSAITDRLTAYFYGDHRSLHCTVTQPNAPNTEHKSPDNPTSKTFEFVGGPIIFVLLIDHRLLNCVFLWRSQIASLYCHQT